MLRFLFLKTFVFCLAGQALGKPIVIAHRGASGYLPEHTLPAKALAYGMGADFLEQDVVLSKDNVAIVLHDIHLDTTTNVAEVFPARKRADGRYYVIDFTVQEIKSLKASVRIDPTSKTPTHPQRFPLGLSDFRVSTLAEEIEMIQGLNQATKRKVGLYVEIKSPKWHEAQGADITKIVHELMSRYGYPHADKRGFIQCFEASSLLRLKNEFKSKMPLIQLIGENSWGEAQTDFDHLQTDKGLREVKQYAAGIGPSLKQIYNSPGKRGRSARSTLVDRAQKLGLLVHPYTLRNDALPQGLSLQETLDLLFQTAKVDGIFTDFPDTVVWYLERQK